MDDMLAGIVKKYGLEKHIQAVEFEMIDKSKTVQTLSNLRQLLENCSSRNLFNSYDNLNHVLKTVDMDVLELTLELLVVPGRKLDSHKSLRAAFQNNVSLPVIEALTGYSMSFEDEPSAREIWKLQQLRLADIEKFNMQQQLNIRLMAIFLSTMMTQKVLSSDLSIFNSNPSIITEVAQHISLEPSDYKIASVSMLVLRSFLKFDGKLLEISNSLRLSSPHGSIMNIMHVISGCVLDNVELPFPNFFFTSFVDLFIHLAASHDLHPAFLSSRALQELVNIVENVGPVHYKPAEKIVVILENLINKSSLTFEPFLNLDGLHKLVKKIQQLVSDFKTIGPSGSVFLSALLRVVERLLVTFASEDRMRNLVETALFDSLKTIAEESSQFPSDIYSHAIAIISAFIHNEPTTLTILQERNVPQVLIDSFDRPIPADCDVLSGVVLAFGATCLNSDGENYFRLRNPLGNFLEIFLDSQYTRPLMQHGNSSIIGQSMDEFIRHHPSLKQLCISGIMNMLRRFPESVKIEACRLNAFQLGRCETASEVNVCSSLPDKSSLKSTELSPASMVECLVVFLEPLILNDQIYTALVNEGVIQVLLECLRAPGLGPEFPSSSSFHSFSHLFQRSADIDFQDTLKCAILSLNCDKYIGLLERFLSCSNVQQILLNPTNEDNELAQFTSGLVNILSIVHECCSLIMVHSDARPRADIVEVEEIGVKLDELLAFVVHSHWAFFKLELDVPRPWFATAMQTPLPFTKTTIVNSEKFSEYADPTDQRIVNLKILLTSFRNTILSGSLLFNALFKQYPGVHKVAKACSVGLLQVTSRVSSLKLPVIVTAQLLAFVVTLWNSMVSEQSSVHGYLFSGGVKTLAEFKGAELFLEQLGQLFSAAREEFTSNERLGSSASNLFILILLFFSRLTDPKSYRGSFWDELASSKSDVATILEFVLDVCNFAIRLELDGYSILSETGYRLLFNVFGHVFSAYYSVSPKDMFTDFFGKLLKGDASPTEVEGKESLKHFVPNILTNLIELGKAGLAKYPKTAVDLGQLLAKKKGGMSLIMQSDFPSDVKLELFSIVLNLYNRPGGELLKEVDVSMLVKMFTEIFDAKPANAKAHALLSLRTLISVDHAGPCLDKVVQQIFDDVLDETDCSLILAALIFLVSFVHHRDEQLTIGQLQKIISIQPDYLKTTDKAFSTIPNLVVLLFRLSVENAEEIPTLLVEYELLEKFNSWSFPQRDGLVDKFGSILLRVKGESDLLTKLFQIEGPGIIPKKHGPVKRQIEEAKARILRHTSSEWSIELLSSLVGAAISSHGESRIIIMSVLGELIGAYEFLRQSLLHLGLFEELIVRLVEDLGTKNEVQSKWSIHFLSVFLLPPSADLLGFRSSDQVAPFSKPIINAFVKVLRGLPTTKNGGALLKSTSEALTSLLSLTSADLSTAKMVTLTIAAQLIENRAILLLANALKATGVESSLSSSVIELMELISRIGSRFIAKVNKKANGQQLMADLEDSFASSDMLTDAVEDAGGEYEEDVDMDILEEEGVLEGESAMNESEDEMMDMEEYDEVIDTSNDDLSEDDEDDEDYSDAGIDSSDIGDGYEITFDGEEPSETDSDMAEEELVFEVDPNELVSQLSNVRPGVDLILEPAAQRSAEDSSMLSSNHDEASELETDYEDNTDPSDYSTDYDEDDDGFIDLHIDIPIRRRSSAQTWPSFPRMPTSGSNFVSRIARALPQLSVASHPLVTPGPFVISGSSFDERMRPILEPHSETVAADPKKDPEQTTILSMFDRPFFVSTVHRWDQLAAVAYGRMLEARLKEMGDSISAVLEKEEEIQREKIATEKLRASSTDEVIDSDDFSTASDSDTSSMSTDTEVRPVFEDQGMDPSFLAAVPFDMLEEVLEQYFIERRANIPPNARVIINQAYLDSLPSEIRDMYVVMNGEEIHAFRYMVSGMNRVLTTQDHHMHTSEATSEEDETTRNVEVKCEYPSVKESSLLLVDNSAIRIIIRSYLAPQVSDKRTFYRLVVNLCQQPKICADVMGLLLFLLEESPTDQSQLEWALEHYPSRKRVPLGSPKTPIPSTHNTRRSNPPSRPSSTGPSISPANQNDPLLRTGPSLIFNVQRILQLLSQLVIACPNVKEYFVTKSDRSWTIKRQGRNSAFKSETRYPIALLVAAFESPLISGHTMLTEQLLRIFHALLKARESGESIDIPTRLFHSFAKSVAVCDLSNRAVAYAIHIGQSISRIPNLQSGFVTELCELIAKLSDVARKHLDELGTFEAVADPLSPQCKSLRILKVLAAVVYSRPGIDDGSRELTADTPNDSLHSTTVALMTDQLERVCENFSIIEKYLVASKEDESDVRTASALLSPIECYFVCCRTLAVLRGETHLQQIESFTEKHQKCLNSLIRATPALLTVGSLRILTRTPKHLDFDNKRVFFRHQLHRRVMSHNAQYGTIQLNIRRANIFEDTYRQLMSKTSEEVRYGKVNVKFHGEDGVDAGGVTREWLSELSREIFNPNYALFKTTAADRITYQPNRASCINPEHLQYFKFVGRIIGKALYDNRLLDCYFTRSFYKHMLGIPVDFKDLEAVDLDYYKSLNWMLENDITDLVEQTFSVDTDEFGVAKTVDLKPNGRNIMATEENKREYVQLLVEYRLHLAIKPQIDSFLSGLYEIIPLAALEIFNEQELELLISGLPDIDTDDWKANTELTGYIPSSPQIQWFWRCVRAMDVQERTQLIQFVTGTSKVPLEGFSKLQGQSGVQKFQIHRDYGSKDRLPSAHTCFNQLDLPEYESYEQLRDALMKAIKECSTGFGLA